MNPHHCQKWKRRIKLNTKKFLRLCLNRNLKRDTAQGDKIPIKNYSIIRDKKSFTQIYKNLCCDTLDGRGKRVEQWLEDPEVLEKLTGKENKRNYVCFRQEMTPEQKRMNVLITDCDQGDRSYHNKIRREKSLSKQRSSKKSPIKNKNTKSGSIIINLIDDNSTTMSKNNLSNNETPLALKMIKNNSYQAFTRNSEYIKHKRLSTQKKQQSFKIPSLSEQEGQEFSEINSIPPFKQRRLTIKEPSLVKSNKSEIRQKKPSHLPNVLETQKKFLKKGYHKMFSKWTKRFEGSVTDS
ncbi:unnamed protein product [Moneuplotes crassus]|uniref:Uncharacterized protein n=1 Tax=Euplotes crassus TaxID=5936 RepID=A0AAD1UD31_EUPCR|nr:unnamed protein product [Moneuplotes crassus]